MAYREPEVSHRDGPIELPIVPLGLPLKSLFAAVSFTSLGVLSLLLIPFTRFSWTGLGFIVLCLGLGFWSFAFVLRAITSLRITYHPADNLLVVVERSFGRDEDEQLYQLDGLRDVVLERNSTDNWIAGFNHGRLPRWRLGLDYVTGDFDFQPLTDDFHYRKRSQLKAREALVRLLLSEDE